MMQILIDDLAVIARLPPYLLPTFHSVRTKILARLILQVAQRESGFGGPAGRVARRQRLDDQIARG